MSVSPQTKEEALKALEKIRRLLNLTGDILQPKKKGTPSTSKRSRKGGKG